MINKRDADNHMCAIDLLGRIADSLPLRSIQRDIVTCALLYLEGDLQPGGTVARWWGGECL